jgi:hypothetical protein
MRKIIFTLFLVFLVTAGHAQNGLEKVIVEKYYVSNAADSIGSSGNLPVGSVTYRIFVDMLPAYKFQMAYGSSTHPLVMSTTTSFFNNTDYGNITPSYNITNAAKNTVLLDSWLSVGGAATGELGVLKSDDTNGAISHTLLQNADTSAGIALTTADGMVPGTVPSFTSVGFTTETDVFNDGSANGSKFTTSDGAWSCLSGSKGPDTTINRVLIAQITTNGVFHYELNIQIGEDLGNGQSLVEKYVVSNPVLKDGVQEITIASLKGTLGIKPTIQITTPVTNTYIKPNTEVTIEANAAADVADTSGSIVSVEFYIDGVSVGVDETAPYSISYTGVVGSHVITAVATDAHGNQTVSSSVSLIVSTNTPPTISLTAPLASSSYTAGEAITISATAADADGTVSYVVFYVDGDSIGVDETSPYSIDYTGVSGSHVITAKAVDNEDGKTTSASVTITVTSSTGITDLNSASSIKVYPNPATDLITLEIPVSTTINNVSYKIVNGQGKVVYNKLIGTISDNYQENINISSFAKGLYIMVLSQDGKITSQQIIKL